jgi:hypothetical protein
MHHVNDKTIQHLRNKVQRDMTQQANDFDAGIT